MVGFVLETDVQNAISMVMLCPSMGGRCGRDRSVELRMAKSVPVLQLPLILSLLLQVRALQIVRLVNYYGGLLADWCRVVFLVSSSSHVALLIHLSIHT